MKEQTELTIYNNYVFTKKLNLNLEHIKQSSKKMNNFILKNLNYNKVNSNWPLTTKLFLNYNVLMYPLPGFHELYTEIKDMFKKLNTDNEKNYYIQCWLNVYHKGEFIDWHRHGSKELNSWHGFYCVDTESSYTSYRLTNGDNFDVKSENNLLVIGRSGDDEHKSSIWLDNENPRITIAFDIISGNKLNYLEYTNHWIPV